LYIIPLALCSRFADIINETLVKKVPISQTNGGSELMPAHGEKRQFVVPGGQLMVQTDTSWRQPDWRRPFWGVTISGMPQRTNLKTE
jgi:hypothetical protein